MNAIEPASVSFAADGFAGQSALLAVFALASVTLAAIAVNRHRALVKLRETERCFRELYDNINEGVFRTTLDGRMISANPALVRLSGFDSEAEMLRSVNDIGREWYVDPGRRDEINDLLLKSGRVSRLVSEVRRYKSGERIWIEENTRLVRDPVSGAPLHYEGTVREVTETVRRQKLQERQDKIASVVSGGLYQYRRTPDGQRKMTYASVGMVRIFGISPEEIARDVAVLWTMVHPDDVERLRESFRVSENALAPRQCEYRVRAPEGREKWVYGHSVPEREPDGTVVWHGFVTEVTERKWREERILRLACFDELTQLPNRAALVTALEDALRADPCESWCALLFIDLDQFKVLNETKGHHFGDRLLGAVAERLHAAVGDCGTVARFGGDEFVVMLPRLPGDSGAVVEEAMRVAGHIHTNLSRPFSLDSLPLQVTGSTGVASTAVGDCDAEELLKRAELAMYEAKASGRGVVRVFEPGMQESLEERLALTDDLRAALDGNKLAVAYQAQVDRDGVCVGAEMLLRWHHRRRGDIGPTAFLPLAEHGGFMTRVDEYVLQAACRTLRAWQDNPLTAGLSLAINISAYQLGQRAFVATVAEALAAAGVDPARLTLELTERVMLDDIGEVSEVMGELKALGVRLALDDFGMGYSSLSHLRRLPIDILKIDKSFVGDLAEDEDDRLIVQTIVNIAHSLRVSVIAEGVETEFQAELLRTFGCHAHQGFLYARPVPREAFVRQLEDAAADRSEIESQLRA